LVFDKQRKGSSNSIISFIPDTTAGPNNNFGLSLDTLKFLSHSSLSSFASWIDLLKIYVGDRLGHLTKLSLTWPGVALSGGLMLS
jgi:hypothetical protein